MFTNDSKLLFGMGAVAAITAAAWAIGSSDRLGSIILATAAAGAVMLGAFLVGRAPRAQLAGIAAPAPNRESDPLAPSAWPMAAGLAAVLLAVGLAIDVPTIVLGLAAIGLAGAGWFVTVWREHAQAADPAAVYAEERVVGPAGVPIIGTVAIGFVIVSVSRILLAIPKDASTAVAIGVAVSIFVGAMVVSSRSRVSGGALAGLLVLVGGLLVVGGVVAAANGERTIEPHAGAKLLQETAKGTAFTQKQLAEVGDHVLIHFRNEDANVIHNIAVYTDKSATKQVFFGDAINGLGQRTYVFDAKPGTYFYRCEFHPTQMTGTLTVEQAHAEE